MGSFEKVVLTCFAEIVCEYRPRNGYRTAWIIVGNRNIPMIAHLTRNGYRTAWIIVGPLRNTCNASYANSQWLQNCLDHCRGHVFRALCQPRNGRRTAWIIVGNGHCSWAGRNSQWLQNCLDHCRISTRQMAFGRHLAIVGD